MMLCSCSLLPNSLCMTAGLAVSEFANRMMPLEESAPNRLSANANGMTGKRRGARKAQMG